MLKEGIASHNASMAGLWVVFHVLHADGHSGGNSLEILVNILSCKITLEHVPVFSRLHTQAGRVWTE